MSDTANDGNRRYLTPREVGEIMPPSREGKPSHPTRVIRFMKVGTKLSDGSPLHMRAVATPAGLRTTREWVEEFLAALTADVLGDTEAADPVSTQPQNPAPAPTRRSPARRARDMAKVEAELDRLGV